MNSAHSRGEIVLLQKIFAAGGPVRNLLHVQLTVLRVPWFVPGDLLIASAMELALLPEDIGPAMTVALTSTLSAEEMAALLQKSTFPLGRALAFTDFLAILAVCKRHYAQRASNHVSPEALHEAVRYVVEGMGDWKEDHGGPPSPSPCAGPDDTSASAPAARSSVPASTAAGDEENLKTYLSWFGVGGDLKEVGTNAFLKAVQRAAETSDQVDTNIDPLAASLTSPPNVSIAQVGNIALGLKRQRAAQQRRKDVAQKTRGASILGDVMMSTLATPPIGGAISARDSSGPSAPLSSLAGRLMWLEPPFPVKGVGPRCSMFSMDTPPTTVEWDEHRLRMVSATMRCGAKKQLTLGARLNMDQQRVASHRSVAELLRLPRLSQEEVLLVEQRTREESERSSLRSRSAGLLDSHLLWRTGGPEKKPLLVARRPPTSLEINFLIDETYRKARDFGVRTSKADANVERRLAENRRNQAKQRVERRKAELRAGFTL